MLYSKHPKTGYLILANEYPVKQNIINNQGGNVQMNYYYKRSSDILHIPTRKDFHKEYAGEISPADFNTNYPNPHRHFEFTQTELDCQRRKADA